MDNNRAEISKRPRFLFQKALPFVLIQSRNQLIWCLSFVGFGIIATYLLFPPMAIPFVATGICAGLLPTLVASLPYELEIVVLDPGAENTWSHRVRAILSRFNYKISFYESNTNELEVWSLAYPGWRLPWRETDMRILIGQNVLRVQGPRSVVWKLCKRLNSGSDFKGVMPNRHCHL